MKKKLSLLLLTAILLLPVTGCHNTQAPEAQTSLPEVKKEQSAAEIVKEIMNEAEPILKGASKWVE